MIKISLFWYFISKLLKFFSNKRNAQFFHFMRICWNFHYFFDNFYRLFSWITRRRRRFISYPLWWIYPYFSIITLQKFRLSFFINIFSFFVKSFLLLCFRGWNLYFLFKVNFLNLRFINDNIFLLTLCFSLKNSFVSICDISLNRFDTQRFFML